MSNKKKKKHDPNFVFWIWRIIRSNFLLFVTDNTILYLRLCFLVYSQFPKRVWKSRFCLLQTQKPIFWVKFLNEIFEWNFWIKILDGSWSQNSVLIISYENAIGYCWSIFLFGKAYDEFEGSVPTINSIRFIFYSLLILIIYNNIHWFHTRI